MAPKDYNPERCEWHERKMREADERMARVEKSLYTTNGEPGLIETVRTIARIQRWHTAALLALLAMQLEQPVRDILATVLRQVVMP